MQNSLSYFGTEWSQGTPKSTKDPLYLEMPDNVHYMVPTTVKVYINDPIIRENAQYVEIEPGNSNPYSTSGNQISITGGGAFRQTMKYDGEEIIEFGFRPTDGIGYINSVVVKFYMTKETPINEYPDTHDETSPFFGYNCHYETNELLCSKDEGCRICNYIVGVVIKDFMVNDVEESISIPNRVDFINEKEENGWAPGSQSLSYSDTKIVKNDRGDEFENSDRYTIKLNTQELSDNFEAYKENDLDGYTGEADNVDNPYVTVNDLSIGGPELTGKAYEMVYNKPFNPQDAADFVDIQYQLFAEMAPKGSGVMIVKASRQTAFEKGTGGSELEDVQNDAKKFISSYKLNRGKIIEPDRELRFIYEVRSKLDDEETTEDHYVVGHISDYYDHPLPYMEVIAKIDGLRYEGITDKDGIYKIPLVGLELKKGEEKDVLLLTKFNYLRDGKNYFNIFFRKTNNRYFLVQAIKKGKLVEGEHLQIDFVMDGEGEFTSNLQNKEDIKHYSLNYFHTAESVEFVLETLKETLDYKLPISVFVGNRNKNTLYSPTDSEILISADDASLSDSDRPDNREYHEFMHALMYDVYNAWPEGGLLPGTKNHDGYLNPSTADSYMEGFAEFMAMVISDEMGEPNPQMYADFGSMDQNHKMWDQQGYNEEFAVAALLWDMYDDYNEKGDELTLSLNDIWKVLKVKRKDFYEYYKAFKSEFPKKSDAIDKLFILHGLYEDTRQGDGNYTPGEPWKYTNEQLGQYKFIDMSDNVTKIKYQDGLTVGKATNYLRLNRSSARRIEGSYLKVKDDEVDFYKIIVSSNEFNYEYIVDRKDDKIYISPLPTGTDATITVVPFSKDYVAKETFTISSNELNEKLFSKNNEVKDFFDEHEFKLTKTGSSVDEKYILFNGVKPTYDYEGDLAGDHEKIKVDDSDDFDRVSLSTGFKFPLIKILLFLAMCVFGYFYFTKPKFKKKSNVFFKKVLELVDKAFKWFIKYGWPKILKFLKFVWKLILKIIKLIFHHSKEAYHATKPHIKKAHEKIKKKLNKNKTKKR
jgi:hypothetical protein